MLIADEPLRDDEADALFRGLEGLGGLVIAASGGPDSTALLLLVARWAKRLKTSPKLLAVTIDHGLRPEAAAEAAAVKRLARQLGVQHRTLAWRGTKPKTGLQKAARLARYRLLMEAAARARCAHVLTAHTLDDQAETVLFRLARGSGLTGLAGMATASLIPVSGGAGTFIVRPLLHLPKARLDRDVACGRHRLQRRSEQPRSALHARAAARADARTRARGLERAWPRAAGPADAACGGVHRIRRCRRPRGAGAVGLAATRSDRLRSGRDLPTCRPKSALRLLGRAIAHAGNEGPVELGKLEALYEAVRQRARGCAGHSPGASITLTSRQLSVERAPARRTSTRPHTSARRNAAIPSNRKGRFTK